MVVKQVVFVFLVLFSYFLAVSLAAKEGYVILQLSPNCVPPPKNNTCPGDFKVDKRDMLYVVYITGFIIRAEKMFNETCSSAFKDLKCQAIPRCTEKNAALIDVDAVVAVCEKRKDGVCPPFKDSFNCPRVRETNENWNKRLNVSRQYGCKKVIDLNGTCPPSNYKVNGSVFVEDDFLETVL